MRKKITMSILLMIALCASYIFAKEMYKTMPNEVSRLYKRIDTQDIVYEKIGIELSGIQKSEALNQEELQKMNGELVTSLTTNEDNVAVQEVRGEGINTSFRQEKDFIEVKTFNDEQQIQYNFSIKNQKDISYNTYCKISIVGKDVSKLDGIVSGGKAKLKEWISDIHESIYFIGHIEGKISAQEGRELVSNIFKAFSTEYKDYYEDDLNDSTYVYYGYTPYFDGFIKGKGNMKMNIQVGFKYNDEVNQTEVIIAFPLYNLPF